MPAIAVIINEGAGSSKGVDVAELGERFRGGGLEPSVTLARSGSEVVEAARRAREGGTGIVVAGGGDGTINAVAGVLVGTDVALGVLPIGTLNHFAKTLHIPMKPDLAAETIIAGYRTRVDVGEVNGTIFLKDRKSVV